MPRPLTRPLGWRPLLWAAALPVAVLNCALAANTIAHAFYNPPFDYLVFVDAAERVWAGSSSPYRGSTPFIWSPRAAYPLIVLDWIGPDVWRLLHVVAAFAFPTWTQRLLVLALYPFWFDVNTGNIMVFVALVAVYAMRAQRWAGWTFLGLTLLMPRPLMLPIAAWLLWKQPEYRVGFAALVVAHGVAVLATPWWAEWIETMLFSGGRLDNIFNIGPGRLLGTWWLLAGVPLGWWLFRRGQVGWAGLAISPYVLPQYLLIALASSRQRHAVEGDVAEAGPRVVAHQPDLVATDRGRAGGDPAIG